MNNVLNYKGYIGNVEFSEKDRIFFGKVLGIQSLISYEGTSVDTLIQDFQESIDEYLDMCKTENFEPETSFKGTIPIELSPELHKQIVLESLNEQVSLNDFVVDAIKQKLKHSHIERSKDDYVLNKAIQEYEQSKTNGTLELMDCDDVWKELGL